MTGSGRRASRQTPNPCGVLFSWRPDCRATPRTHGAPGRADGRIARSDHPPGQGQLGQCVGAIVLQWAKSWQAPPPDPLPSLWKCRPVDGNSIRPQDLEIPAGFPHSHKALSLILNSELRTRREPLICVYFECHAFARESPRRLSPPKPRPPRDALGLPRSPLCKRPGPPHDAGLDATPHPLAGELGEPVRRVPASRRPPLAVLLDAPRAWWIFSRLEVVYRAAASSKESRFPSQLLNAPSTGGRSNRAGSPRSTSEGRRTGRQRHARRRDV